MTEPRLAAEDATIFYTDAFNLGFFENLIKDYAGYYHWFPRALASLSIGLSLDHAPLLFTVFSLLISALVVSLIQLPSFGQLIPDSRARFCLGLLIACAPYADSSMRLFGLHWYIAFGQILLMALPASERRGPLVSTMLYSVFAIWTSPGALAATPAALWKIFRPQSRSDRLLAAGYLCSCATWIVIIRTTATPLPQADLPFWEAAILVVEIWFTEYLPHAWFGVLSFDAITSGTVRHALILLAGLLTVGVFYTNLCEKRPGARRISLMLWVGLLVSVGLVTFRHQYLMEYKEYGVFVHSRYFQVPIMLLYTLAATALYSLLQKKLRSPRSILYFAVIVCIAACYQARSYAFYEIPLLPDYADQAPKIRAFRDAYEKEHRPGYLTQPAYPSSWALLLKLGHEIPPPKRAFSLDEYFREPVQIKHGLALTPWMGLMQQTNPDKPMELKHPIFGDIALHNQAEGRFWFYSFAQKKWFWTSPGFYPQSFDH